MNGQATFKISTNSSQHWATLEHGVADRRGKSPQIYKLLTCIWFATKKSLLFQGEKSSKLKDKLKQALANPIPLIATESETESEPTATVNGDTRGDNESQKVKLNLLLKTTKVPNLVMVALFPKLKRERGLVMRKFMMA